MKVPLSWLKEYVDITTSPGELGHMLTMAGLEVEAIGEAALHGGNKGVVTGVANVLQAAIRGDKAVLWEWSKSLLHLSVESGIGAG